MLTNYLEWIDRSFFLCIPIAFLLNGLVSFFWHHKFYKKLKLKAYRGVQRIHLNETPRLGGLIIIAMLAAYGFYNAKFDVALILKLSLISIFPLSFFALKEDLFHNVKPAFRLLAIITSGILFVIIYSGPYPNFEEFFFLSWLDNHTVKFLFYPLALSALANGSNLTDGVNGLCGLIFLSILGSLLFLAYQVNDTDMLMLTFMPIVLIFIFLCFNYPFGKIFLGDLGAYALSFFIGILTITFFGRHPKLSPLLAALILIYPITEVIFSIFRRLIVGQPIHKADAGHIHVIIFNFLRKIPQLKQYANSLVTPSLSILWLYPLITIPWTFKKPILILFFIPLFLLIYTAVYLLLPKDTQTK